MRLILFDIDGTLLHCGPQVRGLFTGALTEVYGRTVETRGYSFAGRTDPGIVHDLLRDAGVSPEVVEEGLPTMQARYLERLEAGLDGRRMRLLPGVLELLEMLEARSDVQLGLLTGNWQGGAQIKLSRFDLNRFFTFGAYGDDGVDRNTLPPIALERALAHTGRRFRPEETLIIGDSLLDVACGRASGVPVLAVATGFTPAEQLAAAGAHWVAEDLVAARASLETFAAA
jgi:phosphoglycolate phosphatase-like HAD superfamily hydrolase